MPGFKTKFQKYSGDRKEVFITNPINNYKLTCANIHLES